jgi:hypothetical protein
MRRLPRDPLTLAAAASLLVYVAVLVLGAWHGRASQAEFDAHVARAKAHSRLVFDALERTNAYIQAHPLPSPAELQRMNELTAEGNRLVAEQNRLSTAVAVNQPKPTPYASLVMPAASVLPLAWIVRSGVRQKRKAKRLKDGCCVACGYDLRASPGRCPECGTDDPRAA